MIVRVPATAPIVIVVPWEKPPGYTSFATELSAFTYDVGPSKSKSVTVETPFSR